MTDSPVRIKRRLGRIRGRNPPDPLSGHTPIRCHRWAVLAQYILRGSPKFELPAQSQNKQGLRLHCVRGEGLRHLGWVSYRAGATCDCPVGTGRKCEIAMTVPRLGRIWQNRSLTSAKLLDIANDDRETLARDRWLRSISSQPLVRHSCQPSLLSALAVMVWRS